MKVQRDREVKSPELANGQVEIQNHHTTMWDKQYKWSDLG